MSIPSEGNGWSLMKTEISSYEKTLNVRVRPDFLPHRQKTTVLVGLRPGDNSPVKVQLWRSGHDVWAETELCSPTKTEISDQSSTQRIELRLSSVGQSWYQVLMLISNAFNTH